MSGLLARFKKKKEETKSETTPAKLDVEKKKDKQAEDRQLVKKEKKDIKGPAYRILIKPLVSEKATVSETLGAYTFVVDSKASKVDVANAVKQVYGVRPIKTHIVNLEGKSIRRGRSSGKRRDWKKAVVTLPKGQSISIHEGV